MHRACFGSTVMTPAMMTIDRLLLLHAASDNISDSLVPNKIWPGIAFLRVCHLGSDVRDPGVFRRPPPAPPCVHGLLVEAAKMIADFRFKAEMEHPQSSLQALFLFGFTVEVKTCAARVQGLLFEAAKTIADSVSTLRLEDPRPSLQALSCCRFQDCYQNPHSHAPRACSSRPWTRTTLSATTKTQNRFFQNGHLSKTVKRRPSKRSKR
jgi:hypothetical protein